jgi:hypothetical protein
VFTGVFICLNGFFLVIFFCKKSGRYLLPFYVGLFFVFMVNVFGGHLFFLVLDFFSECEAGRKSLFYGVQAQSNIFFCFILLVFFGPLGNKKDPASIDCVG